MLYNACMTQEQTENIQPTVRHKNVQNQQKEVLYTGKRVQREIQYVRVHNHRTGEFHHDSVSLKTYRKSAKSDWTEDETSSISLSDNNDSELTRAIQFIQRCRGETDGDLSTLLNGDLKARIVNLMKMPSQDLSQGLQVLKVASYRQSLKDFYKLLKQPQQSADILYHFFGQHPWFLQQGDAHNLHEKLPRHALGYSDPLTEEKRLFVVADHQKESPLFTLNDSCSAWVPTAELSSRLGEITYELHQLNLKLSVVLLMGDIGEDPEQQSALTIFNQHQQIQVVPYSRILERASQSLKRLQEQLKQQLKAQE